MFYRQWSLVSLLMLFACAGESENPGGAQPDASVDPGATPSEREPVDPEKQGPYPVGTTRFELGARDGRRLVVQLWYPAVPAARAEAAAGHPIEEMEPPGSRRETFAALAAAAPEGCTSRTMHAATDAAAAVRRTPWPVVLYSHCNAGVRFGDLTVAERLASWGYVVAAPDHDGNTLYDALAGVPFPLNPEFLQVRANDIADVLDAVLEGADGIPAGLRNHVDATRIGMFGHSFGSITTGLVLQNDARVKAGVMLAAAPENPLLTGVKLEKLEKKPAFFFHAGEDNSIPLPLNALIPENFARYPARAWLLSAKDAGHWSFSSIAGITMGFEPGCGEAMRHTDPSQTFTYIDNELARSIARAYVTAALAATLSNDAQALTYLNAARPAGVITLEQRP